MNAGKKKTRKIEFRLKAGRATSVSLAGSFNGWDPNSLALQKDGDGFWRTTLRLPEGRYEYRFLLDGEWVSDPEARETVPNPFGSENSVAVVESVS